MEIGLPVNSRQSNQNLSLYQQGLSLIEKLYAIPGFEVYLFPEGFPDPVTPSIDPVAVLWHVFRLGVPLGHLVALKRKENYQIQSAEFGASYNYDNICKKGLYYFLVACKSDFEIAEDDLFNISEIYKDDTNVFVKVLKVVNMVVDKLESSNSYPAPRQLPFKFAANNQMPKDNRSKVISELVETERKYTESMEKLLEYQNEVLNQEILSKDKVRAIFVNLDQLVDFQRRFLVAMETCLSLPFQEQRIGLLFLQHENMFNVYVPFCANYQAGIDLAVEEVPKLQKLAHLIDPTYALGSFMIKPVQRICKYPLLLSELVKYSDPQTYEYVEELEEGLESVRRIADLINEQKRQKDMEFVKDDLFERIEDWKGLSFDEFGSLVLHDRFPMVSNDTEKEYHLYLFDKILLCCKESAKKKKKRNSSREETSFTVKGNIYVSTISGVLDISKSENQVFELKVYWTNYHDMESFLLKCRNEEQVKLWKSRLDKLVELSKSKRKISTSNHNRNSNSMDEDDHFDPYLSRTPTDYSRLNRSSEQIAGSSSRRSHPVQSRRFPIESPASSSLESLNAPYTRRSSPPLPSDRTRSDSVSGGSTEYPGSRYPTREASLPKGSSPVMTRHSPRLSTDVGVRRGLHERSSSQESLNSIEQLKLSGFRRRTEENTAELRLQAQLMRIKTDPQEVASPSPFTVGRKNSATDALDDVMRQLSQSSLDGFESPRSAYPSYSQPPMFIKIKAHFNEEIFMVALPTSSTFDELYSKLDRKIKLCAPGAVCEGRWRLKYRDQYGDHITIRTDEDVQLAFDDVKSSSKEKILHLYIS